MLSLKVKCFIYKPIIRPMFTYGSETCVVSKQVENLLRSFERKVLQKIFGPVLENGYRGRCENSEICQIYVGNDVECIKLDRVRSAGHKMRMKEVTLQSKLFVPNQEKMHIVGEADQCGGGAAGALVGC
jgi:hypothetical protein